jgi:hypothetical protein
MTIGGFGQRRTSQFEPPIELRFVDLFMIIVTALMFVTVMLSIISAFVGSTRVDVAPRVATTALPTALLNQPYHLALAGTGGASPYTWQIVNGVLPANLKLDSVAGVITGAPTKLERTQFTIELTDTEKRSARREVVLEVRPSGTTAAPTPPQIRVTTAMLMFPDAVSGSPYNFRLAADGGAPPYQWTLAQGKLPTGLNLTPSGELVGVPTEEDTSWEFTLVATDATNVQFNQPARLLVKDAPTPLWMSILFWIAIIATGALVLTGLFFVGVYVRILLYGMPPTQSRGFEGWLDRRRRQKYERKYKF